MNQESKISKPPAPFLAALGLSVGFMAFVAWDQSRWLSRTEDYSFGWLVPLLHQRRATTADLTESFI